MEARVNWKEGLAFDGLGGSSGLTMPLDTSVESGGSNSGFRPMELLLVGLAGCTGMDVISILQKKKQDVTDFEVRVHGDRAEDHPKIFTHILIDFIVTGHNVDRAAVDRA
ncbi:MAG TPA: OsmC family protein, partial [Anaerolinea sp.]|nr:OsmC family protein [Anaerolinea sp.]